MKKVEDNFFTSRRSNSGGENRLMGFHVKEGIVLLRSPQYEIVTVIMLNRACQS